MKKKLVALILGVILTGGVFTAYSLEWNGTVETLLNAAKVTGTSQTLTLKKPFSTHAWHIVVTGSPSSVSVTLQGSIDGTNWTTLDTSTTTTAEKRYAVNMPNIYIRSNLGTLSGGTAPTVTVKYLASDN
jgi:hypothetical protein